MVDEAGVIIFNIIFIFIAYGCIIFQKIGALNAPKFGEEKATTVFKGLVQNKAWLIGIILNLISIPYSMFLLSISSLSFSMVLQRAGIILLIVYALYGLKEKIRRNEIIGLVILYTGFILIALVLQVSPTTSFNKDPLSLTWFAIAGAICLTCYLLFRMKLISRYKEIILPISAGIAGVMGSIAMKLIPLVLARDLSRPDFVFNFFNFVELGNILVGIFIPASGYFLGSIYFYCWMGFFIFNFIMLQITYQHGRAVITVPLTNNTNFLISLLYSYFIFQEKMMVQSWLGAILMIVGIALVSKIETKVRVIKKEASKSENITEADKSIDSIGSSDTGTEAKSMEGMS
ncbi:MAG: hypothetical protein ACFFCS_01225 [Candidatus Hodarchaeota archaeon]